MPVTPNMHLNLPEPGETRGPEWAEKVNAALEDGVDTHDHSSGRGVKVPVSGLDVSSDFPFNGNNADSLRMARFDDQTTTLAGTNDKRGFYVVNGDLYYNNGAGTPVRITEGATLSAAAFGAITNLPSVAFPNASAAWLDAYPGFAFFQASNVYARVKTGSVAIHEAGVVNPNAITVKSPASLAAAYDLTLPPATPAADAFLTMNTSGAMTAQARAGAIGTTDIATGAVTNAKLASDAVTDVKVAASAGIARSKVGSFAVARSTGLVLGGTTSTSWQVFNSAELTVGSFTNNIGGIVRPFAVSLEAFDDDETAYVGAEGSSSVHNASLRLAWYPAGGGGGAGGYVPLGTVWNGAPNAPGAFRGMATGMAVGTGDVLRIQGKVSSFGVSLALKNVRVSVVAL